MTDHRMAISLLLLALSAPLVLLQDDEELLTIRPIPFPHPLITAAPPSVDLTYWVSFASIIRPAAPLSVHIYIAKATRLVTLRLDLVDYDGNELQDGQNFTLKATGDGKVAVVLFYVSSSLKEQYSVFVRARAWGGIQFDGFQRVTISSKRLSIFLQTDKKKYKPGQLVQFRALTMTPDLQVVDRPMDIVITDPLNNRIAQWLGVQSDDDTGVFQGEMLTSSHPPLGDWKITATVEGVSEENTFTLEEYEIPEFEVLVIPPSYALVTDLTVVIKVTAKYTFGASVKGTGVMVATVDYYNYVPVAINKTFELDENGEGHVVFTIEELIDLGYKTYSYQNEYYKREYFSLIYNNFKFNATVTNALTEDVMSGIGSLKFYESALILEFTPETTSVYKPGMNIILSVIAKQPDGKPVENPQSIVVTFNVTYFRKDAMEPLTSLRSDYRYWPPIREEVVLLVKKRRLDNTGRASLVIWTVPEDAEELNVRVTSGNISIFKYVPKFQSPAKVYVHLELTKNPRRVGGKAKIIMKSNVPFKVFFIQIYSKGELIEARSRNARKRYSVQFSVLITTAMVPVADVVVFLETANGEVVADRVVLETDPFAHNELSVSFVKPEVKPGEWTKLQVRAKRKSTVFILGVDKSVRLLGTGNDITSDQVQTELSEYDGGDSYFMDGWWRYSYSGSNSDDVFRSAGAGIITDGYIPGRSRYDVPWPFQKFSESSPTFLPRIEEMKTDAVQMNSPISATSTSDQLRIFFPETWLWMTIAMKDKKRVDIKVKAPDTITTWVITAFGVHPTRGLTVAKVPAELLTIKKLFVTLDLPYSAVRGEDVCFRAVTFNRYDDPVQVSITLAKNASAFLNILVIRDPQNPGKVKEVRESRYIATDLGEVQPNNAVVTVFCLSPQSLGDMPVQVQLIAKVPADGLVQTILIKPEGVQRSQSYPVLIEIVEGKFNITVDIELPDGLVTGSLRITVAVVGDIMGIVAEHLEDLLNMPYGCGEQNMINFAPNTYLLAYLTKTNRLTPSILLKAKSFMLAGYQGELAYQRTDGSFSAFGNSDLSGTTWLTAFVVKCFVQAAALGNDIIIIDPVVVNRAVSWLTGYQNDNGSFREPGQVFHSAMQGGSAEGLGLTAYIIIALKEAENSFSDQMTETLRSNVSDVLTKAVSYLESQLSSSKKDSYLACILAYALTLAGSAKAQEARDNMNDLAIEIDILKYWAGPVVTKETSYPWYRQADSFSIEMTSYALLASMKVGQLDESIPIFRWLNKQRGPQGGFISTQDTVLGFEAMASMSQLALGNNFSPINVQISWYSGGEQTRSLTIDEDSVLLFQKIDLLLQDNNYPDKITITATTTGNDRVFALAEVVAVYNLDSSTIQQAFNADPIVSNNTATSFVLTTCVRRTSSNASKSMVIAEIGIPSGYAVNKDKSYFGNVSKVEFPEGKVVIYYYWLDTTAQCSVLKMDMKHGVVAKTKPAVIRVYDYYNPDDEFTTMYSLKQFGVCDLEPEYMDCPYAK